MRFSVFIVLIVLVCGCDVQFGEVEPAPKPAPVPEEALWVGGPDGGVFVLVAEQEPDDKIYSGTIYFDTNGEVWFQGRLRYTGEESFDVKDRASYAGWDGDFLFLRNGEKLVALSDK